MKPLTRAQCRALHNTARKGGAAISSARHAPKGSVRHTVARTLLDEGWVTQVNDTLLITQAGRAKLAEPVPEVPVYLKRRDGLTTLRHRSVRDEPEVLTPSPDWAQRAEAHRKLARADTNAARLSGLTHPDERMAELRRLALERGQDVASELKRIDLTRKAHNRAVKALERKVCGLDEAA